MASIEVKTRSRSYHVVLGSGTVSRLSRMLKPYSGDGRLFAIFDAKVFALHGRSILSAIKLPAIEFVVPEGEKAKTTKQLSGVYDYLLSQSISRKDLILGIGGGATTDLAGYAAATVLRGVRWAAMPTTLLAMVDAAIGGKTGVNHRAGKNLIGAFWQPEFVLADTDFLGTLDPREMRSGLGEVLKCAGLAGGDLLSTLKRAMLSHHLDELPGLDKLALLAARYKAAIVSADEREAGRRAVLNFGHTFGHAIERAAGYGRIRHGEAVAIGISAALRAGKALGYDSKGLQEYTDLVDMYLSDLPRHRIDTRRVMESMVTDKKRVHGDLRFVLLSKIGSPILSHNLPTSLIRDSLRDVIERRAF